MNARMLFVLIAGLLLPPLVSAQIVEYYSLDAIGNVRVVTDQQGKVIERHDYLPFGEECTTGPCASNPGRGAGQARRFTGKERDAESGFDYFGARYYGSKIGRFTTTDPFLDRSAALLDPQRWNRYAYGRNNALRYVDPDGRDAADVMQLGQQLEGTGIPWAVPVGVTLIFVAQHGPEIAQTVKSTGEAIAESGAFSGTQPLYPGVEIGRDPRLAGISFNKKQGTGPKADQAAGTTSAGQATDEYGNKLGPSGKPVVHETESTTRERARNKALNEGSGVVEHSNPKEGKPHFHPADAQGEKKLGSTHHTYPE